MDTVRLIVTILLFAAIFVPNPYGYYVFSRWIIFGICAYYVFEALKIGKHPWALLFGIVVVINNPIFPIHWGSAWLVPYFASMFLLMWGVEYAGLDEIGLLIAKSRTKEKLGDEEAQARDKDSASTSYQDVVGVTEPEQFKPSKSLKQLYREAAKSFHPDLATDEDERERRHCLMVEVNRAFHDRDEERLQGILREWKRNPDEGSSIDESDAEPSMEELLKEMAEGESELTELSDNDVFKKNISGEIKTILVVANDETMRDLLSNFMRFSKYNAVSANSQTGLQEYLMANPDLVITDLMMAGMNGFQLLKAIRKQDFSKPVIMFSGYYRAEHIFTKSPVRPDVFLEAPFTLEAIDKCVKDLLSLSCQELEKRHRDKEFCYYPRQSEEPVELPSEESVAETEEALSVDIEPEEDESGGNYISKDDLDAIYESYSGDTKETEIDIEDAKAWVWIDEGVEFDELGHNNEALQAFEKAIQLKPDDAFAWYGKGVSLYKLGRYHEALHALDKVIQLDPAHAEAWYYRGIVFSDLERYDEALQCCEKTVQLKPDYAEAWKDKGWWLHHLGRYDDALHAYKRAIQLRPDYILAWGLNGVTLQNLGRFAEALQAFEKATQLDPDNAVAWYSLAQCHALLKQKEGTLTALKRAISLYSSFRKEVRIDPNFENLWNDKDFKRLVKRASWWR